ncbi:hypothetical protein MMAG44476_33197 [Mycolicibacterium mageritense DSM 44476 = CIP 104973]|uniref:DUF805 domain-containing protein n=2 Tax=Mycolicibacterium mageritense TaxID=53462 RepID=A0AAI8TPL2_MYCME|nr:DUF805 domain-containing protein [Mycolicibacterium mageritense]MCC9181276.1 DUF805 domain-containing protein [Mycolicibacterium mageritense]TXI54115.1 MAG: DUF805 domain-containing protein [Mycolicibacterium mageritense]CDO25147.1 Inner membrane protein YhaH [Mycolicibacterium mageritense DSM 44476 = CIP 104973]BBX31400.1 hypothetical protein MMAGJ_06820 [Mycolicibacterium mageritense]BDY26521.1 hypothetical protein hbim_00433 [Mycolicibacterium mageritense]
MVNFDGGSAATGSPHPQTYAGWAEPPGATDPDDLSLPLYGAGFTQALSRFFRSYIRFSGRASRSEYWWPALAFMLMALASGAVFMAGTATESDALAVTGGVMFVIATLVWIVPSWAVLVRRLHDADQSGWLCLLTLLPYVGGIASLVFGLLRSKPEGVRFDDR